MGPEREEGQDEGGLLVSRRLVIKDCLMEVISMLTRMISSNVLCTIKEHDVLCNIKE